MAAIDRDAMIYSIMVADGVLAEDMQQERKRWGYDNMRDWAIEAFYLDALKTMAQKAGQSVPTSHMSDKQAREHFYEIL